MKVLLKCEHCGCELTINDICWENNKKENQQSLKFYCPNCRKLLRK